MSEKRQKTASNETSTTNAESEKKEEERKSALALFFDRSNSDKKLTGDVPAETIPYDQLLQFLDFESVVTISRVSKAARQTAFHFDDLGDKFLKFRGRVKVGEEPFNAKWRLDRLHHASIKSLFNLSDSDDRGALFNYILPRCTGLSDLLCMVSDTGKTNMNVMKSELAIVLRAVSANAGTLQCLTLTGFDFDKADVRKLNLVLQRASKLSEIRLISIKLPRSTANLEKEGQSLSLLSKNTLIDEVTLGWIDYTAHEENENTAASIPEVGLAHFGAISAQNLSSIVIAGRAFRKDKFHCTLYFYFGSEIIWNFDLEVIREIVKRAENMERFHWDYLRCWEILDTLTPEIFKGLLEDLGKCKKLRDVCLPVKNDEYAKHICNFLDKNTGINKVQLTIKKSRNEQDDPNNTVDPFKLAERFAKIRKIDRFSYNNGEAHKCKCSYCLPVPETDSEEESDSDSDS